MYRTSPLDQRDYEKLDLTVWTDISNTQAIDTFIANGRVFRRDDLDALVHNVEVYVRSTWEEDISTAE